MIYCFFLGWGQAEMCHSIVRSLDINKYPSFDAKKTSSTKTQINRYQQLNYKISTCQRTDKKGLYDLSLKLKHKAKYAVNRTGKQSGKLGAFDKSTELIDMSILYRCSFTEKSPKKKPANSRRSQRFFQFVSLRDLMFQNLRVYE